MDTPGTSSSSDKDRMEAATEAISMLAQGKRNMVCGEIPNAVNQFQEACKVLAKTYGETAKECAEAYFYYGQSLLDLARMETGVLGNALQGVPDEDEGEEVEKATGEQFEKADNLDRDERDRLRMEVYDAMAEQEEGKEKKDDKKSDEKDAGEKDTDGKSDDKDEKMDDKDAASKEKDKDDKPDEKNTELEEKDSKADKKEAEDEKEVKESGKDEKKAEQSSDDKEEEKMEASETSEEKKDEEGDTAEEEEDEGDDTAEEGNTAEEGEKSQDEGEGKEDPDDVSNLQLAWEMLELAKVIYLKEEDKEAKLKAAEAYLKLGEVSLETEQYEQSISDFKDCLKIQEQHLEQDDRLLAETHYQLGLAHGFNKQYDEAVNHYNSAIKGIEAKIAKLNKVVEEKTEGKGKEVTSADDPVKVAQQEIKELMEILPDIKGKIEDTEEEKKNLDELKNVAKGIVGELAGAMGEPQKSTELSSSSSSSSEPQKKATDITHLIRRKRKPEEEENDIESKKTKQENGSGDAATQNGVKEDPNKAMDVDEKKKAESDAKPAEAVAS